MAEEKSFGMQLGESTAAGAANTLLGQLGGFIFGKQQDKRQLKQQEKLQKLQIAGNKEMLDYSNAAQQAMQMQMWNDTNLPAQVAQAKKAGLSVASLMGGSGAGGATTGGGGASGSVGGAVASDPNGGVGMGLQMASQLALQKAQKENIEADTANKKAETVNTGVKTETGQIEKDIKERTKDDEVTRIREAAYKQVADTAIAAQQQKINEETLQSQIRKIQEDAIGEILNNKQTTIENRKKEAETTVEQFKAKMASQGIDTNSPWYIKLGADLINKIMKKVMP